MTGTAFRLVERSKDPWRRDEEILDISTWVLLLLLVVDVVAVVV
jgi:hypothetical protein